MERTWKPTTAGILSIIAGCIGLLIGLGLAVGLGIAGTLIDMIPGFIGGGLLVLIAVPGIILGVVAIVGGIYALKRRLWVYPRQTAFTSSPLFWEYCFRRWPIL